MGEQDNTQQQQTPNPAQPGNAAPPDAAQNTGGQQPDNNAAGIPKARFDQVIAERNELRSRLEALEQAQAEAQAAAQQAEQRRLEEQGNWQQIAEQRQAELDKLKPVQEQAAKLLERIKQQNQTRIQAVPEDMRSLIPADLLSPEQLSEWLDSNVSKLTKPLAPNTDPGQQGERGNKPTPLSNLPRPKVG